MRKILFSALFSCIAVLTFAQNQTWKELDDYHAVMAQTFHPSEEGNLQPIKERSGELAEKAKILNKSTIPSSFQKPGVKESLKLLAKESKAMHKLVQKKKTTDAEITTSLAALHDRFHEVVEKCHH